VCEWESRHDKNYSCQLLSEPGSRSCIFHTSGNKDPDRFAAELERQLHESGESPERNPRYNFRGYVFPGGIAIRTVSTLRPFGGLLIDCDARPNLVFDEAVINGDVNCIRANIRSLSCSHADVKGIAMFLEATVEGLADFRGTRFAGATFASAKLRDAHFEGASFEGQAYFEECEVGNLYLGLDRPTIFPVAQNREGLSLSALSRASFWRFARRYFEKYGHREKADAAFYFERLWRFRQYMTAGGRKRVIIGIVRAFDFLFLRITTAYGASVSRVIGSWLAVICSFGLVYAGVPTLIAESPHPVWTLSNWLTAFSTSIGAFAMHGPGGAAHVRMLGKLLVSVEAIIGGVLMALLVGVITRKFMR